MKKALSLILTLVLTVCMFAGCKNESKNETPKEKTKINIAALKGPTGFGVAKLMSDDEAGKTKNDYNFTIAGSPDEITAKVISGELDIAAVPTNMASVLYNKTKGQVNILNVNTLGILYVVTKGVDINSAEDLKGKTIYSTGKGAMPEYVLNYILEKKGLEIGKDVNVEYLSEHSELASKIIASEEPMVAVLPQPFVTQVTMKDKNIKVALDLTDLWNDVTDGKSVMSMGCMIVNKSFADKNKQAVADFCKEYEESINYTNDKPAEAAKLIEKYKIMDNAAMVEKAIPLCHATYIDGQDMKDKLTDMFNILFKANPASIGGALPDDAFYYSK